LVVDPSAAVGTVAANDRSLQEPTLTTGGNDDGALFLLIDLAILAVQLRHGTVASERRGLTGLHSWMPMTFGCQASCVGKSNA
jgi:hypothetical protein